MASIARLTRLFGVVNNHVSKSLLPTIVTAPKITGKINGFTHTAGLKTAVPWIPQITTQQQPQSIAEDYSAADEKLTTEIFDEINNQVATNSTSRLFAVVHICGKQFKITENDLITIQGYWPPNPGDKLKLEKVMLVGGTDFTLVGRPILNRELVSIDATVVEKTMSHTKTHFRYKKRKQFRRIHLRRSELTMLRINSININGPVDKLKEVEGLDRVY